MLTRQLFINLSRDIFVFLRVGEEIRAITSVDSSLVLLIRTFDRNSYLILTVVEYRFRSRRCNGDGQRNKCVFYGANKLRTLRLGRLGQFLLRQRRLKQYYAIYVANISNHVMYHENVNSLNKCRINVTYYGNTEHESVSPGLLYKSCDCNVMIIQIYVHTMTFDPGSYIVSSAKI